MPETLTERALVALIFSLLLLISIIDLSCQRIPNALIVPAILIVLTFRLIAWDEFTRSAIVGGGLAFGLFLLVAVVSRHGLGGGDIKLAGFLGLLLGFPNIIWGLLVGVSAGALIAIYLLLSKGDWQADSRLSYAPYLCLGAVIAYLIDFSAFVGLG